MHVDEFIFNCCVSSMISADNVTDVSEECAMNVFSIDENKIRDANGIIFAEAITCYKCTFCGKMFAAMEVVLTHYQSNHRCSVIPLLKGMLPKLSTAKLKTQNAKSKASEPSLAKPTHNKRGRPPKLASNADSKAKQTCTQLNQFRSTRSSKENNTRQLRQTTEFNQNNPQRLPIKLMYKKKAQKGFKCRHSGCKKTFAYHSNLVSHSRTHLKAKSYRCNWTDCQFRCSDQSGLEFHKRTHSGDNPYKCSWPGCDHSFADAFAKDQHLQKIHIGDMTLQCDYPGCNDKFQLATDRDRHRSIHLGKKIAAPIHVTRKKRSFDSSSDSELEIDDEDNEDNEDDEEDDDEEDYDVENEHSKESDIQVKVQEENDNILKHKIDENTIKDDKKNHEFESNKDINDTIKRSPKTPKVYKSKKPERKNSIQKTIFRCDFPGCRKTFPDQNMLRDHEKDTHKTLSSEGRSRYERKCKGNLFYKI